MNCFDSVEERYMLNIHIRRVEDIKKLLSVKTNLYKEVHGDWLVFFMEDEGDFYLLCEDISAVKSELYRIKYEAENCTEKGFFD